MALWARRRAPIAHPRTATGRSRSRDLAEAGAAMGALVAAAHGPVDASGRERTAALVKGNDALAGFPADWLNARLERFCDTDIGLGRRRG